MRDLSYFLFSNFRKFDLGKTSTRGDKIPLSRQTEQSSLSWYGRIFKNFLWPNFIQTSWSAPSYFADGLRRAAPKFSLFEIAHLWNIFTADLTRSSSSWFERLKTRAKLLSEEKICLSNSFTDFAEKWWSSLWSRRRPRLPNFRRCKSQIRKERLTRGDKIPLPNFTKTSWSAHSYFAKTQWKFGFFFFFVSSPNFKMWKSIDKRDDSLFDVLSLFLGPNFLPNSNKVLPETIGLSKLFMEFIFIAKFCQNVRHSTFVHSWISFLTFWPTFTKMSDFVFASRRRRSQL